MQKGIDFKIINTTDKLCEPGGLLFTACPYKIADLSCLHVRIRYFIRTRQRKLSLQNMRNSGAKCQESPKGVNSECPGLL